MASAKEIVSAIVAEEVVTVEGDPRNECWDPRDLYAVEYEYIKHAVAKRRREFAAGRSMARAALRRLGVDAQAVPCAPDRSPQWPRGVVGSISHSGSWCAVAVARSTDVHALGIDVEDDRPVSVELMASICAPRELEWLQCQPHHERGVLAKVIFSAKEAVFKAQYPLTKSFVEVRDLTVKLDLLAQTWSATFEPGQQPEACPWQTLRGRWIRRSGEVATATAMTQRREDASRSR